MSRRFTLIPLAAALAGLSSLSLAQDNVSPQAVVEHYATIAHATYQDSLTTAQELDQATDAFISDPNAETLEAAKQAWLASRVPYQQTEVFRFGNPIVDDWEGQVNAWPLDEGMIDYVAGDDYQHELGNEGANANIIANKEITVGGQTLDVSDLTPELLADLNEIGGSEANVATGYHAIEFLLWGQDLHGFEAGSGERPPSDYQTDDACTGGNCERRAAYLDAVTDLLVDDLEWMTAQWESDQSDNYRTELLAIDSQEGLKRMLFGMGSLSLGELAGERMKVALEANSFEDEHSCFSDNTHNDHYYNGMGIRNVYTGSYERVDGDTLEGPALSDLVASQDAELDSTLKQQLKDSMAALNTLKQTAEAEQNPQTFDMLIAPGNTEGSEMINAAILALLEQTGSIEQAAATLGIDSLEPDTAGHAF